MKQNLDKAFSEILDILNSIEYQFKAKIPKEMLQIFKENCDTLYLAELLADKTDVSKKDYSDEALAILAYLNLKYWCNTPEEKKKYKDMYFNN